MIHVERGARWATLLLALLVTGKSRGEGQAESLIRLVPPNAPMTVVIEDAKGNAERVLASSLLSRLREIPAVKAGLDSRQADSLKEAARKFQEKLGVSVEETWNGVLGDAVVLTSHRPEGADLNSIRGMILVHYRDREILDRLIAGINKQQENQRQIERIEERTHEGVTYWLRQPRPDSSRPSEAYALLTDQVFVWANSESLVKDVIQREKTKSQSLWDRPEFQSVRGRLPKSSLLCAYLDPRFYEEIVRSDAKLKRPENKLAADFMLRYLSTLNLIGGALEWQSGREGQGDAIVLHTEEDFDPDRAPAGLKQWSEQPVTEPPLAQVPESAILVASAQIDFVAIERGIRSLLPPDKENQVEHLRTILNGLLLGRDLTKDVLPNLGPGVLAYVKAQPSDRLRSAFSLIATVQLKKAEKDGKSVGDALDNLIRSSLSALALQPKRKGGPAHLDTREVGDSKVTVLEPNPPFAYAVSDQWLTVGNSLDSLTQHLESKQSANELLSKLRATYFPKSSTFVCLNVNGLKSFLEANREQVVNRVASKHHRSHDRAERDVNQLFEVLGLFQNAYVASTITPGPRSSHWSLGLVAKP